MTALAADYFPFRRDALSMGSVRLTEAPMLTRTRAAGRWHRPRSGRRWPDGRVSLLYWCGQAPGGGGGHLYANRLPDGDLACGTCEGRAVGAGFPSSVFGSDAPVLFAPRTDPPTVCPSKHYEQIDGGWRYGRCLWCGATERVTGGSRGYGWTEPHLSTHAPLALLAPCTNHGWLSMVLVDGQVVCECRTEVAA